ncbi:Got1/Sft2-like family-domain-containing protein [Pelagophyceae sp. CCMP2097]|nr:Got1/Sft2-like family-domain-containing protein [Pelagophyceae sp. CCMP2097]
MDEVTSLYAATRSLITGEPRPRTVAEQVEEGCCEGCPKLTYQQRLIGFCLCFALGILIELGSFFRIVELIGGNPKPFAVCYTVGNVVAICASFFLSGPWTQAKKMCHPTRAAATATYLVAIVATLVVALIPGDVPARGFIIVVLVVVQTCALVWYMLSYIPYARDFLLSMCIPS